MNEEQSVRWQSESRNGINTSTACDLAAVGLREIQPTTQRVIASQQVIDRQSCRLAPLSTIDVQSTRPIRNGLPYTQDTAKHDVVGFKATVSTCSATAESTAANYGKTILGMQEIAKNMLAGNQP
jgi:hypothetical protein